MVWAVMHSAFVASRLRFVCQPELVELAVTHSDALMTLDHCSLCAVSHYFPNCSSHVRLQIIAIQSSWQSR